MEKDVVPYFVPEDCPTFLLPPSARSSPPRARGTQEGSSRETAIVIQSTNHILTSSDASLSSAGRPAAKAEAQSKNQPPFLQRGK
jgi:hypothetical protein